MIHNPAHMTSQQFGIDFVAHQWLLLVLFGLPKLRGQDAADRCS